MRHTILAEVFSALAPPMSVIVGCSVVRGPHVASCNLAHRCTKFRSRRRLGRISVSKDGHVAKIDEICARMHNNTALEGVDPVDMLQANAVECQKNCVDMYPLCTAGLTCCDY
ncbi:hypothetical protein ANCDUO_04035 [Ancylostoma duodenale]|uniref:Uncharacterized protein n=1 Tax=Ancylostoma duodenale TaxID=51022 RepID=A0A0C2D7L5_9BILA|nr:hypothetical protein ANCDUO_04035 [Ancylostoma duodenale]